LPFTLFHSHNLVLIGRPPLLQSLALSINEEIRSRVTYSVVLPRLAPETLQTFILGQLDRAGLGHNTFSPEALAFIPHFTCTLHSKRLRRPGLRPGPGRAGPHYVYLRSEKLQPLYSYNDDF